MDFLQTLGFASENFSRRLDTVADADLAGATPCEDWSVTDLIWHVARGSALTVRLLDGASKADASLLFKEKAPDDVVEACRLALAQELSAFGVDHDLEKIVHHPMGDVPVRQLFDFRIMDLTLHGWDLARAVGGDEEIPDELVSYVLAMLEPLEEVIGQIGVFGAGPSGSLGSGDAASSRLLDLSGRRP
ncbi:MAG: TIGR03086 family metal-binding protein [Acidimicrobiales bacterium]